MNIYISADRPQAEGHGGGSVVFNELEALKTLGDTAIWDKDSLNQFAGKELQDPWEWDEYCQRLLDVSSIHHKWDLGLAHGYAGSFGRTIHDLKVMGCKTSWTCAAHDVEVSRREHEVMGLPFPYKHLTEPDLWERYSRGYKEVDVLIAPGTAPKNVLLKQGCKNKIVVVPHGVTLPEKVKPLPKKFVVGYLGSFGPDKGVRYLLEAWKLLKYKDAVLLLAGKDSTSDWVKHLVSTYGGGSICLLGWQKNVSDFYNQITCYVQPSATEGYGIEINEAASFNRTVICSDGAGAADIVTADFGSVVPACNSVVLAEAIDTFKKKSHDDLVLEGNVARSAAEKLSWDKIKERYIQLWNNLLKC